MSDIIANLAALPDIRFADKSAEEIKEEIISGYEAVSRKTLYPGDPVRLFLETIAYIIVHQRNLIDYTGKMNLLAYANGGFLDHLGALLGVERLSPRAALTTVRFSLSAPQSYTVVIPAGIRTTAGDQVYFASVDPVEIPAGQTVVEVSMECTEIGTRGNGYLPGQIKTLVDPLPWIQSVENVTLSAGGADVEDDEHFRERIRLAPEAFSNAGSYGAYKFWAMSAHQDIIDVAVIGPPHIEPGRVELYPLMKDGVLPTQDILDLVLATCNAEDVRPLTDHVSAHSPVVVPYKLSFKYWIERDNATIALSIKAAVEKAVDAWKLWQRSKIARDIITDCLVEYVRAAGAKRVEIASPSFRIIDYKELAVMEGEPRIEYGGLEDG